MPNKQAAIELGPNGECTECGTDHYRNGRVTCAGHVRYDRATYVKGQDRQPLEQPRPCNRYPNVGLTRCGKHGVNTAARNAGERRVTDEKITRLAQRWAVPIETTPTEAILGRVSAFAGHVKFYGEMVAALDDDAITWGVTKETDDSVVVGNGPSAYVEAVTKATREASPNVWVQLYNDASDRLVKFAAEALRAGVEERRVRVAEQVGQQVAAAMRAVAARLNLTTEQAAEFAVAAPEEIRRLYAA